MPHCPVAIGAVGGSGTRIIAQFLRDIGYFMGGDLNSANDNLWFAMLFNRRDILLEPRHSFRRIAKIFYRRMTGRLEANKQTSQFVMDLADRPNPQHQARWLKERAISLLNDAAPSRNPELWGWKAPIAHVTIDRLLESDKELRYIHVVRHGLDMAFSSNQNQLRHWGPVFLCREVEVTPRQSLAYWCAVHRRMETIARQFGNRIMFLDFDRFCVDPTATCRDMLAFIGKEVPDDLIERFASTVVRPDSVGRFRRESGADFDPHDLAYVSRWGYPVT